MIRTILCNIKVGRNISKTCSRTVSSSLYKKMEKSFMIDSIKSCIPPLDNKYYKGQAGRIGIVGGSLEYTGAPYFAGISALKVGADLVHVFCTSSAATVIKSFSPELIVHPLLDQQEAVEEITPWFDRLHAIVIGPGLGREPETFNIVSELIVEIKARKIPLIIDADGLFLITENPDLIRDFSSPVILTPNKIEYERLCSKAGCICHPGGWGGNLTVLMKGETDELTSSDPEAQWVLNEGGSGRRCGGQGDLLSGAIATFLNWTLSNNHKDITMDKTAVASSLACYAASVLVRRCNEKAFKLKGRSMLPSDMIEHIHEVFEELFGQ